MVRVVLLGTGTNVGKTFVGSNLLRSWAVRGRCLGSKPIESGVLAALPGDAPGDGQRTDAHRLDPRPAHLLALREPISPHLAARREGKQVALGDIVTWIQDRERAWLSLPGDEEPGALSLVETAGGAFSPLTEQTVCADLAAALEPALWLLIAPDSLGVLHDLTATLIALGARYRAPDAVILSAARSSDASTGSNAQELEGVVFPRLGAAAPRCPRVLSVTRDQGDLSALCEELARLSSALRLASS